MYYNMYNVYVYIFYKRIYYTNRKGNYCHPVFVFVFFPCKNSLLPKTLAPLYIYELRNKIATFKSYPWLGAIGLLKKVHHVCVCRPICANVCRE